MIMASTNPSKSFQSVYDVKCVFQHHERRKVPDALDFNEAAETFEVLYKKGLAKSTPSSSQLSKFRDHDVLVGHVVGARLLLAL